MKRKTLNKQGWVLPAPPKTGEKWLPVVRLGRMVPWGYKQDPDDKDILLPIPEELEVLEVAKKHLRKYSYKDVSMWLSAKTGRYISPEGLRKRIKIESDRQRQATNARLYAEKAAKAAEKAEKLSKAFGGAKATADTSSDS